MKESTMRKKYFEEDTLDDLMHTVLESLVSDKEIIKASRGSMTELMGPTLVLNNPRARLSRSESKGKLFSALGELLWYLSGDIKLEFVRYYVGSHYEQESDDGVTVRSGYGERLFRYDGKINQVKNVIDLLKKRPSSRQAVIQIFDASDIAGGYKSIPCTCVLQFLVRDNKLNLITYMRSNDAYLGLPHDVFAFTMLQEIIARSVGVEVGVYQHSAGSLHLYECARQKAEQYLSEGWQSTEVEMSPMPEGDPWPAIQRVCEVEAQIRLNQLKSLDSLNLPNYWLDLCRLLLIFRHHRNGTPELALAYKREMHDKFYHLFIDDKVGG